ncbi:MAG: di-heme oxidoredictase family protein [Saprospiraceae bacterium]|nr:c-type cytochrome [Lewinellaceae bacterium]
MRISIRILFLAGLLAPGLGCEKTFPGAPAEADLLDGPVEGLSNDQARQFLAGDIAFNNEIFTVATGLGPLFVATSCGSCHPGDGKGHPTNALIRFGQSDSTGNQFLHLGGPQLQHRALPGYGPEQLPLGAPFTKLLPPANTGLGFLEIVPDADILALADPDDLDGDGISGRPNWVTLPGYLAPRPDAVAQHGKYIGRFGKKAAVYDLLQQTANAYNQDMGVTSTYAPTDTYSGAEIDPEVSNRTVEDVVFYLRTLKAPITRNASGPDVATGKLLFEQSGCAGCHKPVLRTGASPIAALAFREIAPYTDLLLHDMGPELDDGYTEGTALSSEWRTPPLWGLGLSKTTQGGQYYLLHDGRANSIEAAILLHGGEGTGSREKFKALSETERRQLIAFLESL